jgi:acetyl esterase/lipase
MQVTPQRHRGSPPGPRRPPGPPGRWGRLWTSAVWASGVGLLLSGCGGSDSVEPGPSGLVLEASSTTALTGEVGDPVAPVPRVVVRRGDDPATGVEVTFSVSSGGGSVSQTRVTTDAAGVASPGHWVLGTESGAHTLTAASPSLPGRAIVFTATAAPAEPSRLAFSVPPSLSAADRAITPAVEVEVTDAYGNRVTAAPEITMALAPSSSASLSGGLSATATAGTATFSNLRIGTAGTGYRLVASSPGLSSATSDPFDIVAGGAAVMAIFQGNGQTAAAGYAVPVPPAVKLLDANGNPVSGATITFAAADEGAVAGASATTDASGIGRAGAWTLGPAAGPQSLSATASGFPVSPAAFTATATAGAPSASRSSVQALQASVAAGAPASIRVTVRDQFDNPVSGVTATLSSTGSNNTLSAPGPTGADGRATGTLSSTKAESKSVSASVNGVVITQTASVNVTPGPVAGIAIAQAPQASVTAGQQVQLTAAAVDAFDNPVPGAPVSWNSGSTSVATVSSGGLVTGVAPIRTTITAQSNGKTASLLLAVYGAATRTGVTYCSPGGAAVTLDLYLPASTFPRPRPAVVHIHGGAWVGGNSSTASSSFLGELKDKLLARGYVVASLNYRLGPTHKWPKQGQDVRCAIRYLRSNAFSYGIDAAKVFAEGRSAGGQLASFLGTAPGELNQAGFPDIPEHESYPSNVSAVASMSGVYDFSQPSELPSVPRSDSVFVGWPGDLSAGGASPLARVSSGDARFLILHGELDADVLPVQASRMAGALEGPGLLAGLVIVAAADHVFDPVAPATVTSPRFTDASPGTETPVMMTMIADFFDAVSGSGAAVASFRKAVLDHRAQVAPKAPEPGSAQRRFSEAY